LSVSARPAKLARNRLKNETTLIPLPLDETKFKLEFYLSTIKPSSGASYRRTSIGRISSQPHQTGDLPHRSGPLSLEQSTGGRKGQINALSRSVRSLAQRCPARAYSTRVIFGPGHQVLDLLNTEDWIMKRDILKSINFFRNRL
jgi:hypothetical protein